jgi:hypothetical protein
MIDSRSFCFRIAFSRFHIFILTGSKLFSFVFDFFFKLHISYKKMVKIYLFVSLYALIFIVVSSQGNVVTHRGNMFIIFPKLKNELRY